MLGYGPYFGQGSTMTQAVQTTQVTAGSHNPHPYDHTDHIPVRAAPSSDTMRVACAHQAVPALAGMVS